MFAIAINGECVSARTHASAHACVCVHASAHAYVCACVYTYASHSGV